MPAHTTLAELQARAYHDSQHWFPDVHADDRTAAVHFSLGIAGEVGELVNIVKKANRSGRWNGYVHDHHADLRHEAADVAIYLLDLCAALNIDLAYAIDEKRAILIERWGDPD